MKDMGSRVEHQTRNGGSIKGKLTSQKKRLLVTKASLRFFVSFLKGDGGGGAGGGEEYREGLWKSK